MKLFTSLTAALIVGALTLTVGASPALAAKGVKKNAEHKHHGKVVSVSGNSFVIHVHHHHKKKKQATANPAAKTAGKKGHDLTLKVNSSTKFETAKKGVKAPASFSSLKPG